MREDGSMLNIPTVTLNDGNPFPDERSFSLTRKKLDFAIGRKLPQVRRVSRKRKGSRPFG